MILNGDAITERGQRGEPITDESFLLMFNAAEHDVESVIPPAEYGERWATELDTAVPRPADDAPTLKPRDTLLLKHRSLQVLRREPL